MFVIRLVKLVRHKICVSTCRIHLSCCYVTCWLSICAVSVFHKCMWRIAPVRFIFRLNSEVSRFVFVSHHSSLPSSGEGVDWVPQGERKSAEISNIITSYRRFFVKNLHLLNTWPLQRTKIVSVMTQNHWNNKIHGHLQYVRSEWTRSSGLQRPE